MNRVIVIISVALVLGACGVPSGGDVEVVDRDLVPFGLLEEERGATTEQEAGGAPLELFLVAGDTAALVPVQRRVDSSSLDAVLDELAAGPTPAEAETGLRSAIPDEQFVAGVTLEGGTATVDLTDDFSSLGGQDQLLAIGQLVLSLTAQPGVGRVTFTLDGDRVEVPRGDGSLTSGSVSRDAYVDLLSDRTPTGAPAAPALGPSSRAGSTAPGVR